MRRSWVDTLLAFVAGLPVPSWLFWLGYAIAAAVVGHAVRWSLGALRPWEFSASVAIEGSFAAPFFWSMGVLNGVATRALATIRPALVADDAAVLRVEDVLRSIPAPWANVALLVGVGVSALSVASGPSGYGLRDGADPVVVGLVVLNAVLSMTAVIVFIIHAVRRLRVIARVHRSLVAVDLFKLTPLYAFASLTAWTGIALVGCAVYGLAALTLTLGEQLALSTVDLATIGAIFAVACALFVAPLVGLHDRIRDEKDRRLGEATATLAAVLVEVRKRVAAGEYDAAGKLNDSLAAANASVAAVARVSTWPWRPETLRGFVSALGLPILLWLVFEVLGRLLG